MSTTMNYIDLFSGIGGFHQAFMRINKKNEKKKKKLKFECIMACDKDKHCRKTYKDNYNIEPKEDVTKLTLKDYEGCDIICGGFPCQPFSNGGKKKMFDDDRGLLFDEIMRIAREVKPKFMFLENVKHILKVGNGEVIKYIKEKIKDNGYHLQIEQISPHEYGIPQQRERVYFICIRDDIYKKNRDKIVLPEKGRREIVFEEFLDKKEDIDEKHFISGDVLECLNAWDEMIKIFDVDEKISPTIMINEAIKYKNTKRLTLQNIDEYIKNLKIKKDEELNTLKTEFKKKEEKFNEIEKDFLGYADWRRDYVIKNKVIFSKYKQIWIEWYEKHKTILQRREIYGKLEWQVGKIKENDSIFNYFIQIRQSGIRVKKARYFPTLVAITQKPIYGKEKRYITPRESARLQSFPDDFRLHEDDKQAYKQFGNAVNVDNAYTVINETLKHYKKKFI